MVTVSMPISLRIAAGLTQRVGSVHRDMSMNRPSDNVAEYAAPGPDARSRLRIAAAFMLVALIWGSTWLVIKHQVASGPAGWTITWRFAIACPFMFLLAWWRGDGLELSGEGARLAVL